ncbi:Yip1 domain-containing protein [Haematococcus lacustris]|uniref:Yip1 domain-containing protein n=1 Tax=Haematococcus lacustris TaxID=44745 RepID=A0A699ZJZ9_HAELA|nr:Yip1 domain-containing protein [Haematococcus lacustris]
MPQEEGRVPAVPSAGPPHYSSLGAAAYGQAGPPPGYVPAVGSQSDTTTVPSVSGKIGAVPGSGEAVLGKLTDASVQHNSLACLVDTSGMAGQGSPGPMPSRPDDGFFGATQQGQQSSAPAASDARPLLAGDRPPEDPNKYPFYNVRRYRPYFNISTKEVLWRVGNSFIGAFRANFMQVTQEAPDLYGPFWIATTLIFVTAVAGNYANYIEFKRSMVSPPPPLMLPPAPANSTAPSASPAVVPAAVPSMAESQWFTDYTKLASSAGLLCHDHLHPSGLHLHRAQRPGAVADGSSGHHHQRHVPHHEHEGANHGGGAGQVRARAHSHLRTAPRARLRSQAHLFPVLTLAGADGCSYGDRGRGASTSTFMLLSMLAGSWLVVAPPAAAKPLQERREREGER